MAGEECGPWSVTSRRMVEMCRVSGASRQDSLCKAQPLQRQEEGERTARFCEKVHIQAGSHVVALRRGQYSS